MTVTVTQPTINVREKLAELDKPTGIAGEAMLRAETPQEQQALIGVGRRNLIINGDFQVSQRGDYSSATAITNGNYYLDRFKLGVAGVTGTVEHDEVVLPNNVKTMSMKVAATSSDTTDGYLVARHIIEDFRVLSQQVVTASMWVRTNLQNFGFRHDSTTNFGDYVTPDGEWHYHTATYQMPTITAAGGLVNQTTLALINYTGSAGSGLSSGDYFEVAQVQLELGKVATPFEHRSYGEELALCKRYYQKFGGTELYDFIGGWGGATATTQVSLPTYLPVEMRTTPTISTNDLQVADGVNAAVDCTSIAAGTNVNTRRIAFIQYNVASGLTQYRPYYARVSNNTSGYIDFDAEL